ncbi:hypothetical protein V501_02019 [Pseudogymnoascus sp. VKM F-4519 (FW-2642)]|nr:hypothetical protein V501_02019 [Pseudogymnoascus sp. VKM F-4519 (FW-2642)]
MPRKQRIHIHQRQALRAWAFKQTPRPSQKACITWFYDKYSQRIGQSTVSESLSAHFESIDNSESPGQSARIRTGNWPDLEAVLFNWQLRIEEQGGVTSGELLQQKAQQIWRQLPQYSQRPCPEFSVGWLQKFKQRHYIQDYRRHGELGSVPETAEDEMKGLRTIAGEYNDEDIYNMDEAALYWKMTPSRGLATQLRPGLKKDKARLSLNFATNATGSDRLPVWIIGKSKTPRALRNTSVSTMGGEWRWNKKAWMNTTVMSEWLQAFYNHIGTTRTVLLTMDNFSAHLTAVEFTPPPNIRICWLPKNSTSRFQPLDQGIIQSFKSHYRRQWLSYMLECYNNNQDPRDSMDLHLAIRWILRSWNNYVSNTTIYNCFRKSTLVTTPLSLPIAIDSPNITSLYEQVKRAGNIQDIMAISSFLNPVEEQELEAESEQESVDPEEVLQDVITEHLGLQTMDEDEEEEAQPDKPKRSIQEAIQALQVVIEFTEGRDDVKTAHLRAIERLEQELEALDWVFLHIGRDVNWDMLGDLDRQVFAIYVANCWGRDVFRIASRFNHSCIPNIHNAYNSTIQKETFHNIRDIEAGEELTISYVLGICSRSERQVRLSKWGFECTCPVCEDTPEGRNIEKQFVQLAALFQEAESISPVLLASEKSIKRFTETAALMRYRDAAFCSAFSGNVQMASLWAEKEVEVDYYCLGKDHPDYPKEVRVLEQLRAAAKSKKPFHYMQIRWVLEWDEGPE